ncbi:MAG: DUF2254 domain-containing protein [Proteobacteria bacterium]|nr:DUF2254 domain-containing protein [Pseudomonadota bacterium]
MATSSSNPLTTQRQTSQDTLVKNGMFTTRNSLVEKESVWQGLIFWGGMVFFFLGLTLVIYLVYAFVAFDWQATGLPFISTVLSTDPAHVSDAIGAFIELLAAILGLMITVVAIVLQLAAQRYGTRLIDLFLADKVNRMYFILMVCSLLYAIIITYAIKDEFYPAFAIQILLILTLLEISLLGPYFLFVFKFLTPTNLLSSIQENSRNSIAHATEKKNYSDLKKYQNDVATSFEQVTDTALSAISQMDRNLGLMAINQTREMLLDYLQHKHKLPKSWFLVSQDKFIGISSEFYEEFCDKHLWVEAKAFMDMELIYRSCINNMSDAVSAIANNTRIIGEAAIKTRDDGLLEMAVKFFNTFIRVSINAKNIRAIFNLFYQYRLLTESIFEYDTKLSAKILGHFLYYGETCLQQGLGFVLLTAAFDLGSLVATAYDKNLENIKELLLIFMALEDKVDKKRDMVWYDGVRTAQLILVSYLLSKGDGELIPIFVQDLKKDTLKQLLRWRDSLLSIEDRKFWEFTDRGYRFEYIDDNQKAFLKLFYEKYILSQPDEFKKS